MIYQRQSHMLFPIIVALADDDFAEVWSPGFVRFPLLPKLLSLIKVPKCYVSGTLCKQLIVSPPGPSGTDKYQHCT